MVFGGAAKLSNYDDPKRIARIAGFLYLLVILAPVSMLVRQRILVPNELAATSQNLRLNEAAFRLSPLIDLAGIISYLGVTGLLYFLFKPAGHALAFTAALFSISGCIISMVGLLTLVAPVAALGVQHSSHIISTELALLPLQWRDFFFQLAMTMFGFYCILTGVLIFRCTFMPRLIGLLMMLSGLCYLAYCSLAFIAPLIAAQLLPTILLPGIIGEGALTLWLLWRGVDADRWRQLAQARSSGEQAPR